MAQDAIVWSSRLICMMTGLGLTAGCGTNPGVGVKFPRETAPVEKKSAEVPAPPAPAKASAEIALKNVNSNDLEAAIKAQKGKIVVVDFWATWCGPCKKEFPHLVELHRAHAKDGVACVSVSVDDKDQHAAALKFLQGKQADFANFLLDEEQEAWQTRWKIKGVPVVYVFDREGQRVKKFDNDDPENTFTYADVSKLVESLLHGKK